MVGNFSGERAPAPVPQQAEWARAELVLGNYPLERGATDEIVLRPWEARIYRRVA